MQEGDFPSLAKRPFEDGAAIEPPAPTPRPTVSSLPAPLQTALSDAVARSNDAHRKFLKNLPGVKNRVNAARRSMVSSEAWVVAQMDLAALEMMRSPSIAALADVDALYLQRLNAEFEDAPTGGAAIIGEKRNQIQAQVNAQQSEIDAMKARLR